MLSIEDVEMAADTSSGSNSATEVPSTPVPRSKGSRKSTQSLNKFDNKVVWLPCEGCNVKFPSSTALEKHKQSTQVTHKCPLCEVMIWVVEQMCPYSNFFCRRKQLQHHERIQTKWN